jgi:hypothetical protein
MRQADAEVLDAPTHTLALESGHLQSGWGGPAIVRDPLTTRAGSHVALPNAIRGRKCAQARANSHAADSDYAEFPKARAPGPRLARCADRGLWPARRGAVPASVATFRRPERRAHSWPKEQAEAPSL